MLMRPRSYQVPDIRTPLPGPNAQELIEIDERHTSPSYTRMYPLAVARGEGVVIEDVDGNRFLDFTAGIAVCATGHCHERVVQAIQSQAAQLLHMSGTDFYYRPQAELARKLAQIAPGDSSKRVFFTNSGAEAVEAALKLARYRTGRPNVIAFYGAFHGRTLGALSLTASKAVQRRGFGPLLPGVSHVDYPSATEPGSLERTFEQLATLFARTLSPDSVAAIIVEPVQGEGGYIVPPAEFLPRLAALAAEHRMLLVADEIQSGMGRTGRMFACEHFGVAPDILCTAKGIASGMPLGAIIAHDDVMTWPPGSHASTFGGNPISCVAALETIALLEEELIANAREVGEHLRCRLEWLQSKHPLIGEVRGLGLMLGMELVQAGATAHQPSVGTTKLPAVQEASALIQKCFERGLLLLPCGKSTIRFCPPLVVDSDDVDIAVGILDEVLGELEAERVERAISE
jgi:4-aminobutyrate aminotransferase